MPCHVCPPSTRRVDAGHRLAFVYGTDGQVAAMKVPGFGIYRQDYYTDIAIATGATFIAKEVRFFPLPV